jgi:hypothetical protein
MTLSDTARSRSFKIAGRFETAPSAPRGATVSTVIYGDLAGRRGGFARLAERRSPIDAPVELP